jgi:4-alpha-glucanotransferase
MNQPGQGENNWGWRMRSGVLTDDLADTLRDMTITYGRTSEDPVEG